MHAQSCNFEQAQDPILVNKTVAARLLGVSVRTIDTLISEGTLEATRIGRRVLLPYAALKKFANSKRRTRPKGDR